MTQTARPAAPAVAPLPPLGSGMLAGGTASQVIGSTIRPASYCGAFGFQTQRRRYQSRRQLRCFQPELHRRHRRNADRYLGHGPGNVVTRRWRCRLCRAYGPNDIAYPSPASRRPLPCCKPLAGISRRRRGQAATADRLETTLEAAGVSVIDRSSNAAVEAAEQAIAESNPLSRGINAWEGRWPLNTYARDMDADKLSDERPATGSRSQKPCLRTSFEACWNAATTVRAIFAKLADHCDVLRHALAAPDAAPEGLGWTGDPNFTVMHVTTRRPRRLVAGSRNPGIAARLCRLIGFQRQRRRDVCRCRCRSALIQRLIRNFLTMPSQDIKYTTRNNETFDGYSDRARWRRQIPWPALHHGDIRC